MCWDASDFAKTPGSSWTLWNEGDVTDGIILPVFSVNLGLLTPCPLDEPLPPPPSHQEIESIPSPLEAERAFVMATKNKI